MKNPSVEGGAFQPERRLIHTANRVPEQTLLLPVMTVHTLHARLNHPDAGEIGKTCYFYDDPKHGVYCEQLVRSTSSAIHDVLMSAGLLNDHKVMPERVTLRFTPVSDGPLRDISTDLPIIKLHFNRRDSDSEMSIYGIEGWFPQAFADEMDFMDNMGGPTEVELCDHLLDFFPKAPALFYCQVSLL